MINHHQRVYPKHDSFFLEHKQRYHFCAHFTKNKNVLDLGCGEGYGSLILKQAGANQVYGVDKSKKLMWQANKKYKQPGLSFRSGQAQNLIFDDNKFDLVVCLELIEHVTSPNQLLKEIKRVLKPNGFLLLSTPNLANLRGGTSPFHIFEFDPSSLTKLLSQYFSSVNLYGQQLINKELKKQEEQYFSLYQKLTAKNKLIKRLTLLIPGQLKAFLYCLIYPQQNLTAKKNDWQISQKNINQAITLMAVCRKI